MTQRTPAVIAAELEEARKARAAFISGKRVEDMSRGDRRMKFSKMSLAEFNSAITDLQREYDDAVASAGAGRPRRRAIGIRYR